MKLWMSIRRAPGEEVATELLLLKAGKIGSSLLSPTNDFIPFRPISFDFLGLRLPNWMDLTGAAALMNLQSLRCWLHFRCPVFQLPHMGVWGHPPLKICSRRRDKWRACSSPVSFEESFPPQSTDDFTGEVPKPLTKEELQALLADSERQKLVKKLSEANQQNRFLKRQLHVKEDALVNLKKELAVMELELQALVRLAEEISKSGIPQGTRKINGKYIHSHLLSRLEAIQEKLKEQIKDVEAAESKKVPLFWCGMAESVQVMGTFDGWSHGEHLSPEYMGSYTKFSTTLMLPPGRYEIKFLVDGEWTLSPEYPTVGEEPMENNLIVVE